MKRTVVGIAIAKRVFQLHWVELESGEMVSVQLQRAKLLEHFANRRPCLIGMEACGGSQHWARELQKLGHEVKLLSARMVKAFVSRNKSDAADARAIWTLEDALQALRPGHRPAALRGRPDVDHLDAAPPPRRHDPCPPGTVRREHAVVARQVHARCRHQGRETGDEVQRLEDDVRRAVPVRRLQGVAHPALGREGQPALGQGWPGDVAAQALQGFPVPTPDRHAGVQGEAGITGQERLRSGLTDRHRLQREGHQPPSGDETQE